MAEIVIMFAWVFGWFVLCIAGAVLWHRSNRRRREMMHQERMTALEKGVPLPEVEDARWRRFTRERSPQGTLQGAIVLIFLGVGGMAGFGLSPSEQLRVFWTLPLPLVFLGLGLLLYYGLTRKRPG
jgi:cytochrome c-type biogenesis protein CcmH/NrfF